MNFLSIKNLSNLEILDTITLAQSIKRNGAKNLLENKFIALMFDKPSLRTRVSFEIGIKRLGGQTIYLSKEDVGLGIREPVSDIAKVLDRWVDGIVARVFSHKSLEILSQNTNIPIINALSDLEHPCQALADILTIFEKKKTFKNITVTFIGDGNNVSSSLALACSLVGSNFIYASPENYKIPDKIWKTAEENSKKSGSKMLWTNSPKEAANNSDVIYTDVWASMGQEDEKASREKDFQGFQVTDELMSLAKSDAIFMHDMPAHEGEEISKGMLEHPNSVVFDQAENRLYAQQAIIQKIFS
ncbi:MAG: ornithine carbamoyltransferase [SAR202 cluster bacterium]|nr:ornithine carbamoyltransferase [SAR202 cluster bacterium]|tara:strand:+ start:8105 stop:9007 length:903 start_codon:yes stop_codon:yes gene_type:complete